MDLTEFLTQLMIDLKMTLDSDISTAEATRCVNRAVDDFSRFMPRERIYETTYKNVVTDDSFTTPAVASDTSIVNAMDLPDTVVDGSLAAIATYWHDVPRPCKITILDANDSITRFTIIIKGTDADGVYREERFYRHDGKIQTGNVLFYSFLEIEFSEITGNATGDKLSVGTDDPDLATGGIWIQLNQPVEYGTESIYSAASKAGTKYTLDTDYEMDYANGRVRMKNGGSLAVSTTYYSNYNKHSLAIDISPVLPDITRIIKVLYPAKTVPEQEVAFSIWENMMTIGSLRQGTSQTTLVDGSHIAIFYETKHAPPTLVGSGSFSSIYDEIVAMGAAGYALLIEAIQYEIAAVTDLTSARTELGLTTGVHTLAAAALAKAAVLVTATTGKIEVALAKVALYLETNATTDNAKEILSDVTDNIADLRTAINTALDALNAYVDEVDITDLAGGTSGAEKMISTGHPLINQLNDGKNVPENYAGYAGANVQVAAVRTQAALAYAQEATLRLANIRSYIEEAGGWMRMGEVFIGEASQLNRLVEAQVAEASAHIAEIDRYLAEAAQYKELAATNLILSDRFRAEGQIRLSQFFDTLRSKAEYRKRIVSVSVRQPG